MNNAQDMAQKVEQGGLKLRAIRIARAKAKQSQQETADRAGITRQQLSRIELGDSEPQARTIGAIAEALGMEVEELYELEERLNTPKASSPRRDDPEVLAWLSDRRASWGVLTEEEFSDRVLAQTAVDAPSEADRAETLAAQIDGEQMRVMRDLRAEFSNPSAGLFPDDVRAASAYRELQRDLRSHYRLMALALGSYAARVISGEESEEAFREAMTEAAA
jgi:transcriptional regulator with XRE-family HTH domain